MENSPEKNIGTNKKDPEIRIIERKEYKKVPSGYTVRQWYSHESEKGPGPGWDGWVNSYPDILKEYGIPFSIGATPNDLPDSPYYIWEQVVDGQIKSPNSSLNEMRPEASPEEFQEMIDQLPVLKEMLREAEEELLLLEKRPDENADKIQELRNQIEGMREEISNREDLIT